MNTKDADTAYIYNKQTVKIYSGIQQSDGLLANGQKQFVGFNSAINCLFSLFCGIMELLIISGASERLGENVKSDCLPKYFHLSLKTTNQYPI